MDDKTKKERDYSSTVRWTAVAVIATLVAVSFIPPFTISGISLRRANILSELVTFNDVEASGSVVIADEDIIEFEETEEPEVVERTLNETELVAAPAADSIISYQWTASVDTLPGRASRRAIPSAKDTVRIHSELVPLEDYDTAEVSRLTLFCRKMAAGKEPVRIAFFGDSFVEGDIVTCDLRTLLQRGYGGAGFGFAPTDSPLTAFRRTVKTKSKGWTSYNLMQYDRTPADVRTAYSVTGWVSRPTEGASTRWERPETDVIEEVCNEARLLFISRSDSRIEVVVNDSINKTFDIDPGTEVREVSVENQDGITSLTLRVVSGFNGFVSYGAIFGRNDYGVEVDNFSIRSNNGQAMLRTDPAINEQIDRLVGYDLVVLQYGLNIMQQGVSDYRAYGRVIDKMVNYVRRCFPDAAILILGVSDRSVRNSSGNFIAMDAVPHLTAEQRDAARRNSASFWPTSNAMSALGGMPAFVQNGWAGKDYTHINFGGGRRIAEMLYDAINARVAEVNAVSKIDWSDGVIDSLQRSKIENDLLLPPVIDSAVIGTGVTEEEAEE